jgi:hypothetical protein
MALNEESKQNAVQLANKHWRDLWDKLLKGGTCPPEVDEWGIALQEWLVWKAQVEEGPKGLRQDFEASLRDTETKIRRLANVVTNVKDRPDVIEAMEKFKLFFGLEPTRGALTVEEFLQGVESEE